MEFFIKNEIFTFFCLINYIRRNENSKPDRHHQVIFVGFRYE